MDQDEDEWLDDIDVKSEELAASRCMKQQNEMDLGRDQQVPVNDLSFFEARATQERFRNIGYLEAFENAKEHKLQDGFEDGYKQAFAAALRIGEILGEAATCAKVATPEDEVSLSSQQRFSVIASSIYGFLTKDASGEGVNHCDNCECVDVIDFERKLLELADEKR